VQNATSAAAPPAFCTLAFPRSRAPWRREKIKPLCPSNFALRRLRWHDSGDMFTMSLLVILFPIIGSLLCVLVCADQQASDAMEAANVRELDLP
jgi:hypothetical protein